VVVHQTQNCNKIAIALSNSGLFMWLWQGILKPISAENAMGGGQSWHLPKRKGIANNLHCGIARQIAANKISSRRARRNVIYLGPYSRGE